MYVCKENYQKTQWSWSVHSPKSNKNNNQSVPYFIFYGHFLMGMNACEKKRLPDCWMMFALIYFQVRKASTSWAQWLTVQQRKLESAPETYWSGSTGSWRQRWHTPHSSELYESRLLSHGPIVWSMMCGWQVEVAVIISRLINVVHKNLSAQIESDFTNRFY